VLVAVGQLDLPRPCVQGWLGMICFVDGPRVRAVASGVGLSPGHGLPGEIEDGRGVGAAALGGLVTVTGSGWMVTQMGQNRLGRAGL
jgi:hypothetical protein